MLRAWGAHLSKRYVEVIVELCKDNISSTLKQGIDFLSNIYSHFNKL